MAEQLQVVFAEDVPEQEEVLDLEYYYPEHRIDQPSPFAVQPLLLNLSKGDSVQARDADGVPVTIMYLSTKTPGTVIIKPGFLWATERRYLRNVPRLPVKKA